MSQGSQLNVALTPEMEAVVNQAVESGEYASGVEVVREALREWKQRRRLLQHERVRLGELWAEGLASGAGRFEGIAEIKAEARRRLLENQAKNDG